MRLISNYKDYYDSLQTFEDELVYERMFELVRNDKFNINSIWEHKLSHIRTDRFTIEQDRYYPLLFGFCGEWFKYTFEFGVETDIYKHPDFMFIHKYLSDMSKQSYNRIHPIEEFENMEFNRWNRPKYFDLDLSFLQVSNLFHLYRSPVLVMVVNPENSNVMIWKNVQLTKFNWQKKQDIMSVYQELEMFVGGVIESKEKSTSHLEDKHRMGSRFDKWSFRKLPQKK